MRLYVHVYVHVSGPQGCPADQVKEVLSRLPAVSQKFAKYWICRARLMEHEGNLDVLPMFEEAVRVVLEVNPPLGADFEMFLQVNL